MAEDVLGGKEPSPIEAGLCASCVHADMKVSEKGSSFVLCGLSKSQ